MKRILTFVCLLALASATIVSAGTEPVMPWTNFSGEMVSAAINAQMVPCPQGEVFGAGFHGPNGSAFVMFYNQANNFILFIYLPDSQTPTYIGTGFVDQNKHDTIPPLRWRAVTEADRQANVCEAVNPAGA